MSMTEQNYQRGLEAENAYRVGEIWRSRVGKLYMIVGDINSPVQGANQYGETQVWILSVQPTSLGMVVRPSRLGLDFIEGTFAFAYDSLADAIAAGENVVGAA